MKAGRQRPGNTPECCSGTAPSLRVYAPAGQEGMSWQRQPESWVPRPIFSVALATIPDLYRPAALVPAKFLVQVSDSDTAGSLGPPKFRRGEIFSYVPSLAVFRGPVKTFLTGGRVARNRTHMRSMRPCAQASSLVSAAAR